MCFRLKIFLMLNENNQIVSTLVNLSCPPYNDDTGAPHTNHREKSMSKKTEHTASEVGKLVGVSRAYINAEIQRGAVKARKLELPTGQWVYMISNAEVAKLQKRRDDRAKRLAKLQAS